jgi:hypothetical protein
MLDWFYCKKLYCIINKKCAFVGLRNVLSNENTRYEQYKLTTKLHSTSFPNMSPCIGCKQTQVPIFNTQNVKHISVTNQKYYKKFFIYTLSYVLRKPSKIKLNPYNR